MKLSSTLHWLRLLNKGRIWELLACLIVSMAQRRTMSRIRFRYTFLTLHKPLKNNNTPFHQHYTVDDTQTGLLWHKARLWELLVLISEVLRGVWKLKKNYFQGLRRMWSDHTPIHTHDPRINEDMTLLRSYNSSHDPGSAQHRVQDARWNIRMKHSVVWLTWLTTSTIIPISSTIVSRLVSFTFKFFPLLHGQDFVRPCPSRPTVVKAAACNDDSSHDAGQCNTGFKTID
jgi:hypothetical protein